MSFHESLTTQGRGPAGGDVLVIGGGRFGVLAVRRLAGRVRCVVEPQPGPELLDLGVLIIRRDGARAGADILEEDDPPVWVVPALPEHFLARWLEICLKGLNPRDVEPHHQAILPVPSVDKGPRGQYYLSLADFLCPDDCPEPAAKCTVTGRDRGEPMYRRLAGLDVPGWRTGVLRSRQLAPGVGGLLVSEMTDLRREMAREKGRWILATACRCHGVVQGFELAGEGG